MVQISSLVGVVALLSSFAAGLPRPMPKDHHDAIGIEVAHASASESVLLQTTRTVTHEATTTAYRAYKYGAVEEKPVEHLPAVDPHATSKQVEHTPAHQTTQAHETPAHTTVAHETKKEVVHETKKEVVHETKKEAAHVTSSAAAHETTPVHEAPAVTEHAPATTTHAPAESLPTHGSGSANWGNPEYNDCVQKCLATYGQGPGHYTATPTNTVPVVAGTGATHTVIVAPSQGVLRYVPFAVNASVGDTIKFMWGANNHTVTKGSALLPCNRTTDAVFASGRQDKDFLFTQVVNSTEPTYFFCGTPGHCQKGMFGIINPTTNFASTTSVGLQMQPLAAKNPTIAAYAQLTNAQTASNPQAARWGSNIDMEGMPEWSHELVAENVLFTRTFLAANPEVLKEDGSIDLSTGETIPLSIPQDVAAALNSAGTEAPKTEPSPVVESAPEPSAGTIGDDTTTGGQVAGAGVSNVASPKVLLAIVAVVTTLLL